MAGIRILIVDDHRTFSGALAAVFDSRDDLEVVAAVSSVVAARAAVEARQPDVILIDVDLDGDNGLELVRELRDRDGAPWLIVLSCHDDAATAAEALAAGAAAFVSKDAPVDELTAVIAGAVRGEGWINPRLLPGVVSYLRGCGRPTSSAKPDPFECLTPRERQVLTCLMSGLDRRHIAARLGLSRNTVRTYVYNILRKLHVHSTLEAVAMAHQVHSRPPVDSARTDNASPGVGYKGQLESPP